MLELKQANAQRGLSKALSSGVPNFHPPRLDSLNMPNSHEERLEWVKKSYERFFEKVREYDALLGVPELN